MSGSYERNAHSRLRALTDCMVADVAALPDSELLAEEREDDADFDGAIQSLRAGILQRTISARKQRLVAARNGLKEASKQVLNAIPRPSIGVIRSKINELLSSPRGQELAIAFRNGKKQSESDLESLWDDLIEMGLVNRDDLDC